ncbi:hypothetical protein ACQI5H_22950 [Mycobacterium heidelbergense]
MERGIRPDRQHVNVVHDDQISRTGSGGGASGAPTIFAFADL